MLKRIMRDKYGRFKKNWRSHKHLWVATTEPSLGRPEMCHEVPFQWVECSGCRKVMVEQPPKTTRFGSRVLTMNKALETLDELKQLRPNWNSYGAPVPSDLAISKARAILLNLVAVPTSRGGVQLELHIDGQDVEIEIGSDGRVKSILLAQE